MDEASKAVAPSMETNPADDACNIPSNKQIKLADTEHNGSRQKASDHEPYVKLGKMRIHAGSLVVTKLTTQKNHERDKHNAVANISRGTFDRHGLNPPDHGQLRRDLPGSRLGPFQMTQQFIWLNTTVHRLHAVASNTKLKKSTMCSR